MKLTSAAAGCGTSPSRAAQTPALLARTGLTGKGLANTPARIHAVLAGGAPCRQKSFSSWPPVEPPPAVAPARALVLALTGTVRLQGEPSRLTQAGRHPPGCGRGAARAPHFRRYGCGREAQAGNNAMAAGTACACLCSYPSSHGNSQRGGQNERDCHLESGRKVGWTDRKSLSAPQDAFFCN